MAKLAGAASGRHMPFLTSAHLDLKKRVQDLVDRMIAPHAPEIEGTHEFPQRAYKAFSREKLFALAMPKAYGGPEADALSLALMVETISTVSPSSALLVFPTNAVLRTIALTGSAEQKDRFFSELRAGDKPMGFCLTEPDYGSDAGSLQTRAERQGDDYIVSGAKSFITLGPHARYYMTFVRTGPGPKAAGISALLIPRDAEGLSFGPAEKKMGLHGSITSQMYLDKVRVPAANRLWGEGEGWRVLTQVANPMRVWGAASMALGTAQGLFNLALEHARTKKDQGRHLVSQQAIGFLLADMQTRVEACRSLNYRACALLDRGGAHPKEIETLVSMAKFHASDTAMQVAEMAGQVMGRAMASGDSLAAHLFCVAKGIQIFDGSNQIQRMIIARNLAYTKDAPGSGA
jgi:alkylation response protein AidB-like acyl-CoA dehydrogenase